MPFTPQSVLVMHFVLCGEHIKNRNDTHPSLFITGQMQMYQTNENLKKKSLLSHKNNLPQLWCVPHCWKFVSEQCILSLKEEALT